MVIIGAGHGISFYVARAIQHWGFNLALVSSKEEKLRKLKDQLSEDGNTPSVNTYMADVYDPDNLNNVL